MILFYLMLIGVALSGAVAASRIPFAAVLGTVLFSDRIRPHIVVGGLLIVASLVGTSGALRESVPGRLRAGRNDRPGDR